MAAATSLVELILKKWGDDIAGAAKELEEKVGFPESVANRIATGELPMDEASRLARAAEQGYDTSRPVYHGTDTDFLEFDPDRAVGSQFWSTTDKGAVESGEVGAAGHGVIKEMYHGIQNPAGWEEYDKLLLDEISGRGYDGLKLSDPDGHATMVAFDPKQYKSTDAAFDPQYTGPNIMGGLALPATAGLLATGQSEDADAGFVTRGGKTLLEAWHGSPHKFDKFSMDQIGTGEGAQAYGHGLYFADSEDVARGYRDSLAGSDGYYNGQRIADMGLPTESPEVRALSHATGLLRDGYTDDVRADTLAYFQDDLDQWLGYRADLKDDPDALKHLEVEITDRKAALEAAKGIDYSAINSTPNGHLYRTEIDVTPESLLDWDKPLSEQSEAVQEVLGPYRSDFSPLTGGALNLATDALGKGVPEKMLSDRGIKGIKYLDGDSRAVGDGTSNYVIFDDSLINIAERGNADPRLLAGTAAGTAGLLAAPMVKDSGMISAPRSEALFDLTMGARDLERRLEGSPA